MYKWTHYETWHVNLEQLHFEGHITLNQTTAIDGTWASADASPILTTKCIFWCSLLPTNLMVIVALDIQGSLECHAIPKDGTECPILHVISAVPPNGAGREKCPELVENTIIIHDTAPSADIITNVVWCRRWEVLQHPPHHVVLIPNDYTLIHWINCHFLGYDLLMEKTLRAGRHKVIYYYVQWCMQKVLPCSQSLLMNRLLSRVFRVCKHKLFVLLFLFTLYAMVWAWIV